MLFNSVLSFHQTILKKMYNGFHKYITVFNTDSQYIKTISEGSCDTEEVAENSCLHHWNKVHLKTAILNCNNIL